MPRAASAVVYISEFMAQNQTGLTDEDGEHSDWLELYNAGSAAVSLNGWYLTDNPDDLRRWQFPASTPDVTLAPGDRLVVFASRKDRKVLANRLHTNFKLETNGGYLALVHPDGLTIEHFYSYPQQVQDISYGMPTPPWQAVVPAPAAGKAKVPLSAADMGAGWNSDPLYDDSGWQAGQTGFGYDTTGAYGALIGAGGDLQAAMFNVNSTALVRLVFNVADPALITAVRLQMKYDDGFVCYLNGTLIAQSNAPVSPAWDSGASADRGGSLTQNFELFNSDTAQAALVPGNNVLAVQLLNFSNGSTEDTDDQGTPNGSRALAQPLLEATFAEPVNYLASATPNAVNSASRTNLGPLLSNTTKSPTRPLGDNTSPPLLIVSKVVPSLRPIASVELKYRIMFTAESAATTVTMVDDGTGGDVTAGDNIYSAQIPTDALPAGQMLRWRVVATDVNGIASTDPPFRDATDNDQYFGTVAFETQTATSQLPVMHWFVQNPSLSQSESGTRCSLFFLDRFYDNVIVKLHGQSSAGFAVAKKSHDFNFSKDNRFTWREGEDAQRGINLITTWADKSKIRDTMAWESWQNAGHLASHWAQLVRVQQNGAFWGVYDMVENGDQDFLQRTGLDPAGALYKAYNSLQDVANVEKKSREFEKGTADLQALETGLNPAKTLSDRRKYAYDNVDIPTLVNYLANNVLILNNDFGHKNYYVYRDSNGTGEWSVLPWDQDLAIGHTWTSSQNYFNDDIHSQGGLILGAASGNRMMNLIMNSGSTVAPEMAQMFLRRLRTLMDTELLPPGTTDGPMEQRANQLLDSIDPPDATFLTDGDLDLQKWGYWLDGGGGPIAAPGADAATHDHGLRKHVLRILNSNPNPPYPAVLNNPEGLGDTRPAFLPGRRTILYNGTLNINGMRIPPAQDAVPTGLTIEQVDFNPASGNTEEEFFVVKNSGVTALDITGWKVAGAVDYTFRGGTVIPAGGGATENIGLLHVTRNPKAFRQRTVGPQGGQFRLVVGGYNGRLNARGGTIELRDRGNTLVASSDFGGTPTPTQDSLRVTELNFAPTLPTAAETAALPGVKAGDFEFIELANIGTTPLDLGGAQFDRGITFTFPTAFMLDPGARTLVVSSVAAFQLRYGAGFNIAGQYEGNFDNAGEEVRLLDNVGEEVLRFTYSPAWYPSANGGGYSLVTRVGSPTYNGYDSPNTWAISGQAGGSPGAADASFSQAFEGWLHDHFTATEEADPLIAGPAADPDNDTRDNLAEYAFGKNPRQSDDPVSGQLSVVTVDGVEYTALSFVRPTQAVDLTYGIEISSDLAAWTPSGFLAATPQDLGNGLERVTFAVTGLSLPHTTYHIRPTALHSTGSRFGDEVTVTTPNTNPVGNAKTLHAPAMGAPTVVYSTADTSDADGDVRTLAVSGYSGSGSVTTDGSQITFSNGGFTGTETIQVGVSDAFGGSGVTTVTLRNEAPAANADRFSVGAGTTVLDVLANDVDPEGDPLAIVSVSSAAGSAVTTDGATITYTPGEGFRGIEELSYVIGDRRGGTASATATLVADHSVARTVAMTNGEVPGISGAVWTLFGVPSIFAEGTQAGWLGSIKTGTNRLNGIFSGNIGAPVLRVRSGDQAHDGTGAVLPAVTFRSFSQPVFAGSNFAFIAKVAGTGIGAGNDSGLWVGEQGALRALAREGESAPGTNGARFRAFTSVAMPGPDSVFFTAKLAVQRGAPGGETGLWVGTNLALREGQMLDAGHGPLMVKSFQALTAVKASPGHGRYDPSEQSIDALITFINGSSAIATIQQDATITFVASSGQIDDQQRTPIQFGTPSSPGGGQMPVALTTFQSGAAGFTAENNLTIFDFAEKKVVAQKGAPAPGINSGTFEKFENPVAGLGPEGVRMTAFVATANGATPKDNVGLWADTAGAIPSLALVARKGSEPPGAPGTKFKSFQSISILEGRGTMFTAKLSSGASRVTAANDQGLWAADSNGVLRLVTREGDQVTGKTLRTFKLLQAIPGSPGQRRSWTTSDPAATLIYLASFTDGTSAIIATTIP